VQQVRWALAVGRTGLWSIRARKKMAKFTLRGKVKVNIQWMLYCVVGNIEKIIHSGKPYPVEGA